MTDKELDIINKIVWYVPFRKKRDTIRSMFVDLIKSKERIYEEQKIKLGFNTVQKILELTSSNPNSDDKKIILKNNLKLIEIEISSYCNRKCWFCPNSIIDRHSKSIELSEELFLKIINNLKEIDYSEGLSFHRFNEPLANKTLLLRRVKQARELLPKANLRIFTNGDYLDINYLNNLREAGVNYILMSYYFSENEKFDVDNIIKPAINKMAKKLGLDFDVIIDTNNEYMVEFIYDGLRLLYRSKNFEEVGSDRGGIIVNEKIKKETVRDYECFYTFTDMYIDYNGLVMPCCNLRSDVETHKPYILGDINKNNLFEIFSSEKYVNMRRYLGSKQVKHGPCEHCHYESNNIFK